MTTFMTLPNVDARIEFEEAMDDVSARLGHAISHGATLELRSRADGNRLLVNLATVGFLVLSENASTSNDSTTYTSTLMSIFA
jgi:hypothetical protein